jgi:hypothetical protein
VAGRVAMMPPMAPPNLAVHVAPVHQRASRLSERLWGPGWDAHLPFAIEEVQVAAGSFVEAVPFISEHYAELFNARDNVGRFLTDPMTDAKRRFAEEMDVFLFRDQGRIVGLILAHPSDWSTYYIRSGALLPAYRRRNLIARFLERAWEPLRALSVERVEAECSPANVAVMRILTGLGFLITATANSERWGSNVRLTRFLREEAEEVFLRQFCGSEARPRATSVERRTG